MTKIDELSLILVQANKIKFSDAQALRQAFFKLDDDISYEEFLLDQGIVDKSDLLFALSKYYGVTSIDVIGEFFDHYLLRLFPKDVLLNHYFIPYAREGDLLTIIAANPSDPHLPVVIGKYITHSLNFMVGIAEDIHETIDEFYDQSNTYQPNDITAQQMERSGIDVHPTDQHYAYDDPNQTIPVIVEETIDDYERD